VFPGGEIRVDPFLERCQAKLLEPGDVGLGKLLVLEIGQRSATPESERLVKELRSPSGLLARLGHESLEPEQVELGFVEDEGVARSAGDKPRPAELLPQLGDIDLNRLRGRRWRALAPELVDQPVARDDLVRPQEKDC
jgi:hypothetical protein